MRLSILSLLALAGTLARLDAVPPPPPADFAVPQTPTKPEPFPVKLVDQGQFDPKLKGYFLPDGFRMEIVVSDPDVINPVGMTFGPDGSLFVMEWLPDAVTKDKWFEVKETFHYRDGTTKQVATMKKFTTDLVKHFRPNTATGKFGPPQIIISEELPSSILYHDDYIYVTGRGTVRRWKQSRPGGPWDIREVIAQGFCGFHHHQVSGLSIGNDGMLYLTSGDDDNFVEGSDGSRATVLRTGAVFRCKPDGSKMETYSLGYRNPYRDLAHDDKFNWFHTDNDNEDGSRFMGCRIMHVAEGTDFGWRLAIGARCCRPDHTRSAVAGELPGKVPPMIKTGRGAPAGLLIYHDTRIPEHYRGLMYYPDVYRKLVRAYSVANDGSTFKIPYEFEFMKSDDPLFRPCQMVTGPDGAIYVCDWRTDSGGAGKLSGNGVTGRIYRIKWAGDAKTPAIALRGMDSWAKITQQSDAELLKTLGAPDLTDRVAARKELVKRGPKSRDLVLRRFVSGAMDGDARLPAMGAMMAYWNPDIEDLFRLLLNDESPDVRRIAAEGLGTNCKPKDGRAFEALLKGLGDSDRSVRRAVALAIGRLGHDSAADTLVSAWRNDSEADAFLKDAYIRGIESCGKAGIASLLNLATSGEKECNLAVDAFLALRSRPAAAVIPEMLLNPHVSPAQRESLVRSFTNYQFDPPLSLEPLADYLAKRPNEPAGVVAAAVEVFAASGGLSTPKATQLVIGLLAKPESDVRMTAIKAVEDARLSAASPALLTLLADSTKPQAERVAVLKALRVIPTLLTAGAVQKILAGEEPAVLKTEALRTLAAIDATAARKVAEKFLDQPDPTLIGEAVAVLGASKAGAKLVGERFVAKKLPRDLFLPVTEALKKFADDPAIAKLHTEVLRGGLLLSLEPGQIEKVRSLVATKGDAKKGKELYFNTKVLACAKCHRMEGVGGSTGPDLTRVWDTHTIDKLLESIVDPNKEIKEGFQTFRVTTANGQVFSGLKITDTAKEVVIRDADGRDTRIDKDDVDSIAPSKVSLMPDNVVSQLSYEQFIDILAFLKSRKEQESLRGLIVEVGVTGHYPAEVSATKPEVKGDMSAKSATKWVPTFAEPSGVFDLKAAFGSASSGVYARAFVHSAKKQTVAAALLAEDPVRVWVNDASAYSRPVVNASAPGEEMFKVELKEGWNVVLMKVVNAGKSHRVGLRFMGDGLRTAATPDAAPPVTPMTGGGR
ncbi:MAG TPA: PVC-type heme-binding CxxCH protein [Gemmataceae bacterium]|nr:PVC-type heme-binding CxxCH protein [Gemmataceae bacterium]